MTKRVTTEQCKEVAAVLNIKYGRHLDGRLFSVSCQSEDDRAKVTFLLANDSESFYYPVEALIVGIASKESVGDAEHALLDFLEAYFADYLADETLLPIDWKEYAFSGYAVLARGQIINRSAEQEADRLLAQSGKE